MGKQSRQWPEALKKNCGIIHGSHGSETEPKEWISDGIWFYLQFWLTEKLSCSPAAMQSPFKGFVPFVC